MCIRDRCIAVLQVGAVHLDGCAADLIGGVNTGGGAADVGLDERQIVLFTVKMCIRDRYRPCRNFIQKPSHRRSFWENKSEMAASFPSTRFRLK